MIVFKNIFKSKDLLQTPVRLICFDFDGVIHSYTSGWKGFRNIPDLPVLGSKEILQALVLTKDVKVVIFSSRNKSFFGRRAMKKYLSNQVGLSKVIVNEISFPILKPAAHVFLDDRGLLFEGNFPSIQTLLDFIPWNLRTSALAIVLVSMMGDAGSVMKMVA